MVTDPAKKQALADIYARELHGLPGNAPRPEPVRASVTLRRYEQRDRVADSAQYLADNSSGCR